MGAFFGSLAFKLLAPLLALSVLAGAYFLWESRIRRAAVIEAQRDQLAQAVQERDRAIAERNRTTARFLALPEVRNRLCAVQGAQSGCCKPEPARCEP